MEPEHDLASGKATTRHRIALIMESINQTIIEAQVIEALRTCFDPEIPVNIYEMGLIYEIKVGNEGLVEIQMTLTSPHCPAVQSLPAEVEGKVRQVDGVTVAVDPHRTDPVARPNLVRRSAGSHRDGRYQNAGDRENAVLHLSLPKITRML